MMNKMIKIIYNRTTNYNKMIKKKYSKKSNKINLNKKKKIYKMINHKYQNFIKNQLKAYKIN
jgi:hypothetical protein